MEQDFTIEEILDMPVMSESKAGDYKEPDYMETNTDTYGECNHGIFCVTGKDSDSIDIDDLY